MKTTRILVVILLLIAGGTSDAAAGWKWFAWLGKSASENAPREDFRARGKALPAPGQRFVPSPEAVCPDPLCYAHAELVIEQETCLEVEPQRICIPPVRFPWSKCPPEKAGRVRTVNVLKKWEFDVPKCQCQWRVEPDFVLEPPPEDEEEEENNGEDNNNKNQNNNLQNPPVGARGRVK